MKLENMSVEEIENLSVEELEKLTGPEDVDPEVVDAENQHGVVQEPDTEPDVDAFFPENAEVPEPKKTMEEVVADLQAELEKLKNGKGPKNHVEGKASNKSFVRMTKFVQNPLWPKIPGQQEDLADILSRNMVVGKQYSEAEIFKFLNEEYGDYPRLANSVQHVTYLFRYYRGLKAEGSHAGFLARKFLRAV